MRGAVPAVEKGTFRYERWTDDEEDQLRREHAAGLSMAAMAAAHGRNQGRHLLPAAREAGPAGAHGC
jgi:hypothetical protein